MNYICHDLKSILGIGVLTLHEFWRGTIQPITPARALLDISYPPSLPITFPCLFSYRYFMLFFKFFLHVCIFTFRFSFSLSRMYTSWQAVVYLVFCC